MNHSTTRLYVPGQASGTANAGRSKAHRAVSPVIVTGSLRILEAIVIMALGLAVHDMYGVEGSTGAVVSYLDAVVLAGLSAIAMFQALGLYSLSALRSLSASLGRLWLGWTLVCTGLVAAAFFFKIGSDFSRAWLALWHGAGLCTLTVGRLAIALQMRTWAGQGRLNRKAIIVGDRDEAYALARQLRADNGRDIEISGIFDDREVSRGTTMLTATLARGRVGDASAFARQNGIDLVLVALPAVAEARISAVLHQVNDLAVDVCLAAGSSRLRYRPRTYTWIGGLPFIALADKPIADWASVQKLVFDKTVAALALTLLAPLMALTALAIRIESKGPVLFRQKRLGFDNEPIEIFKFRSMYVDRCDSDARQLVSKGDPRVTGVGRIIRKTSIDELPQLFNVLMGTLSLVGPRPHALHAKAADTLYHDAVEDYFARHRVKPGVTGWAQIHGWRGETDTLEKISKRVEHDLYYIDNWSIGLDIYILLRTPLALLNTESAY